MQAFTTSDEMQIFHLTQCDDASKSLNTFDDQQTISDGTTHLQFNEILRGFGILGTGFYFSDQSTSCLYLFMTHACEFGGKARRCKLLNLIYVEFKS